MLLVTLKSTEVLPVEGVMKLVYVASLVAFGIFTAAFQVMDFQTTVMGLHYCHSCEVNPLARSLYQEGGAVFLYRWTLRSISYTFVALLFGIVLYFFAEALPVRGYVKYLLYGLSFIAYGYLFVSALYHLVPVYNNLWTLYYIEVGGG